MTCRLCQLDLKLCDSHIISEAFWSGVYNRNHKALPISLDENILNPIQKGIREKLLCESCERKFADWENTLKRDLKDIGNLTSNYLEIIKIENKLIKVSKIRYENFKFAVLSLLWRMSISSNKIYKSYKLGPYEDILREILHKGLPVKELHFPIIVSRYELNGKFLSDMLMGFPPYKYEDIFTVQKFIIYGHSFSIIISNKKVPNVKIKYFLHETGELYIDVRDHLELVSPDSVFSKIFDKDVKKFYGDQKIKK